MTQAAELDQSPATTPSAPAKRRKHRFLRWLIPVVVVVVIVGVVGGILLSHRASAAPATTTMTRDVQASMVTMTTSVSATGTIEPQQRADLSFSSSGTVTAVKVAVGDKVTKGEALATIDTTNLQASVDSAQAAVDAAQSDYDTAVTNGVDAQITATKSTLATKQDALTNAKSALAAATLKAPFAGTVAIVTMSVGDSVGSGGGNSGNSGSTFGGTSNSSSSSGSDTITVISTNLYSVTTSVGASDVTSVAKGQAVEVTPNGASQALKGTVTSVGLIASSSTSSGASFPVTIDITDAQDGLYSGVTASISIITSSKNVLAVPTAAIATAQGTSTVELKNADGTTTATQVTTGDSYNSMTEITAGLKEGDTVEVTIVTGGNAQNQSNGFSGMFGSGNRPSGNFTPGGNYGNFQGNGNFQGSGNYAPPNGSGGFPGGTQTGQ